MEELYPQYFGARKCGLVFLALVALIGIGSVLITPVMAHPPSAMALEYDAARQSLIVAITHTVDDPSSHYVSRLELTRNGAPYRTEEYSNQPAKSEFTHTLAVVAGNGDVLGVTATCNRYGSIKKELTVLVPTGSATPAASTTPEAPGFEPLFALASAGAVCWLLRR